MLVRPSITIENRGIGNIENPVITVGGIPVSVDIGMEIIPSVNVLREDGITPVEDVKVDFFVSDSDGVSLIGDRVLTDASGDVVAAEGYYVSSVEAGQNINFVVVTRRKIV